MSATWNELLTGDHETTERVLEAVVRAFDAPGGPSTAMMADVVEYFVTYVDQCHNKKEENHLFPLIERLGVPRHGGPLGVMLQEHEESRRLLARFAPLGRAYAGGDASVAGDLRTVFDEYSTLLKNHFWKENDILYPLARRVMREADGAAVVAGIEATESALGAGTRDRYYALAGRIIAAGEVKDLVHGLDHDILAAILNTLPIELSFVDADDRVRYFSHENLPKIFGRTRGVIGMRVQNCHPEGSVDRVNAILASFKAGTRRVAEFWIDFGGRKVHIRYFPVHAPDGSYLGCLETVQDVTDIQQLTGQRRLLDEVAPGRRD
jgi:PAS domain S-box-containing protein